MTIQTEIKDWHVEFIRAVERMVATSSLKGMNPIELVALLALITGRVSAVVSIDYPAFTSRHAVESMFKNFVQGYKDVLADPPVDETTH